MRNEHRKLSSESSLPHSAAILFKSRSLCEWRNHARGRTHTEHAAMLVRANPLTLRIIYSEVMGVIYFG